MLAPPVVSRTQRRIERKQLVLIFVLILAVAAVSFSLGVMFGKRSSPVPEVHVGKERSGSPPIAQIEPPPKPVAEAAAEGTEHLTFYDNLPKGKQAPLGSGINLPPAQKADLPGKEVVAKPAPVSPPPAPAPKAPAVAPVTASASAGGFVVQVASFRTKQDATKLADRLRSHGLKIFVETADLGSKGVWYRVLSGPFPSRDNADRAVDFLREKERLSAIVRSR
jgi:septal ring-binding cell division protein DamX